MIVQTPGEAQLKAATTAMAAIFDLVTMSLGSELR
jgi:hypothetical protein